MLFQSTLPVWGATSGYQNEERAQLISIHAPRVGSDRICPGGAVRVDRISIHAPRVGSDLYAYEKLGIRAEFQSTLPVWGATS